MRKKDTTILAIGDPPDYDSFRKFDKERKYILEQGFNYKAVDYEELFNAEDLGISTGKVIVFLFFPFYYWNRNIEHRGYRGIYGNLSFCRKFSRFSEDLIARIESVLPGKDLFFINDPRVSSLYRDKLLAQEALSGSGINVPQRIDTRSVRVVKNLLGDGRKMYIKPRYGSMGKGITFLEKDNWQTNFRFRENRIANIRSDQGWKFHGITGNTGFLKSLLCKDVIIEEAVELFNLKGFKVDFRVYCFLDKVLYIYPRKNNIDSVTTNISQGGKGDPKLLRVMPRKIISKINRQSLKTMKVLKLNFAGIDIAIDSNMENIYVLDVNMFPGFPKRRTFKLARSMVSGLRMLE
ncbi:MAG: hypothetical protein DRP85_02525 [Candidatus Makaraimicrobium thalassicum]|nr:MAG: hypothetical protein DRP85_02525 [Candidatus Omnitrophota bacterium]